MSESPIGASSVIELDWDGKSYELDVNTITVAEFRTIKIHTEGRVTVGGFLRGLQSLDTMDAEVLGALFWLFKSRAGEPARFDDDLKVFELLAALNFIKAPVSEPDQAPKAEGSTPTATSPSSESDSSSAS